jgi:hypothetical protein
VNKVTRAVVHLTAVAAVSVALCACTKECQIIPLPSGGVSKAFFPSWHGEARQCHMGNYDVIGPPDAAAGKVNGELWVIQHGQAIVMIDAPNEINVSYQNRAVLTIQDRKGKGGYDFASYSVRDSTGKYVGSVTDGDMRGQPGFKLMDDGKAYAYIDGSWLPIEKHGTQLGVVGQSGWQAVQPQGLFRYELAAK